MMVGLDRAFKPEWVYRILKICKPGKKYKELEEEFNDIIQVTGLKSKKNILTIIRRHYLKVFKKGGIEYFDNNYLHQLALKYSYSSMKPILLFILIMESEIVQFLQKKINLKFLHNSHIDRKSLLESARERYGDRRVVKYAVGYYLTILSHFGIIKNKGQEYIWETKKFIVGPEILKDIILLYNEITASNEINVIDLRESTALTYIDLSNLENTLRDYNSVYWTYQKRLDANKIIVYRNCFKNS